MTKEQKNQAIEQLKAKFSDYNTFYFTDTESLAVEEINGIRKECFDKQVEMRVAKNTLIRKALESIDGEKYHPAFDSLKGVTALFFTNNPKDPAVIVSNFKNKKKDEQRLKLKLACVEGAFYIGEDQLGQLKSLKSKNELVADVIALLNSPINNLLGALNSSKNTLTGILKTLETKN